jgi:hypothetical protein
MYPHLKKLFPPAYQIVMASIIGFFWHILLGMTETEDMHNNIIGMLD